MQYVIGYLNIVVDAFIAETRREYLDDETVAMLSLFIVEKISHLKLSMAVDAMFQLLKSLGNK
jgi:hypothetical protein